MFLSMWREHGYLFKLHSVQVHIRVHITAIVVPFLKHTETPSFYLCFWILFQTLKTSTGEPESDATPLDLLTKTWRSCLGRRLPANMPWHALMTETGGTPLRSWELLWVCEPSVTESREQYWTPSRVWERVWDSQPLSVVAAPSVNWIFIILMVVKVASGTGMPYSHTSPPGPLK